MRELERINPSAAASLREGMEETLTLHRLEAPALLRVTRFENLRPGCRSEDITSCDMLEISPLVSSNMKSGGNLSILRRTAWFSDRVSTS